MERMNRITAHAVTVIEVASLLLFTCSATAWAQMTLPELSVNVLQATAPHGRYKVMVTQTMVEAVLAADPSAELVLAAETPRSQSEFLVLYDPLAGLSTADVMTTPTGTADATTQSASDTPSGGTVQKSDMRVTTDILKLMKELEQVPQLEITQEIIEGKGYYRIAGTYADGTGCIVWVDAERWYVTKMTINVLGEPFSHTSFAYRQYVALWLPLRTVVVVSGEKGPTIVQDYGEYLFD